jgi:3-deoxy-D-manno-octulosonate 8-phosphate phosphatase (KDO 8-P phosphatase)
MIELIVFDVDGTLTDGSILLDENGSEIKRFSAKDGLLVRVLPDIGIKTMILTGRISGAVQNRAEDLHISAVFQGVNNKVSTLTGYLAEEGIDFAECAYIGDDLNDYAAMQLCGFKACPADAAAEIRGLCDYVSPFGGGHGAVRDICEYIVKQSGKWGDVLHLFEIKG